MNAIRRSSATILSLAAAVLIFILACHHDIAAELPPNQNYRPLRALRLLPVKSIQHGAFAVDSLQTNGRSILLGAMGSAPRIVADAGRPILISGWAFDAESQAAPDALLAVVDGKKFAIASSGGPRPDVATALRNPNAAASGYAATIPGTFLPRGLHTVRLRIYDANRTHGIELAYELIIDAR